MPYLLDANVFISASRLHYGLEMCPAFWDWIDRETTNGTVRSIEAVRDELIAGGDDPTEWAKARDDVFIRPSASTGAAPATREGSLHPGSAMSHGALRGSGQDAPRRRRPSHHPSPNPSPPNPSAANPP